MRTHRDTSSPDRQLRKTTTPAVVIVDGCLEDYAAWRSAAHGGGIQVQQISSAGEALRVARTRQVDLWVINTRLGDMKGAELCSLLRSTAPQTSVYLVADQYSAEDERAAWQHRATLFGCKGAHEGWLEQWLDQRHSRQSSAAQPTRAA